MKLNNTTNWVETNSTQLLTPKGNCVKKILCLALPGFKMVFSPVACMSCVVCLAFAAKKRLQGLDPSWKHCPSSGRCSSARREPALSSCTDVGSPIARGDGPLLPAQLCPLCWRCQQIPILAVEFPPPCFTHVGWDVFRSLPWGKRILHFESSAVHSFWDHTHIKHG